MVASGEFMSIMKPPRVSVPRAVRNGKGNLRKKVLKKPGFVSQLLHSKLFSLATYFLVTYTVTLLRALVTAQHNSLLLFPPFYFTQVEPDIEPVSPSSWGQSELPRQAQDAQEGKWQGKPPSRSQNAL